MGGPGHHGSQHAPAPSACHPCVVHTCSPAELCVWRPGVRHTPTQARPPTPPEYFENLSLCFLHRARCIVQGTERERILQHATHARARGGGGAARAGPRDSLRPGRGGSNGGRQQAWQQCEALLPRLRAARGLYLARSAGPCPPAGLGCQGCGCVGGVCRLMSCSRAHGCTPTLCCRRRIRRRRGTAARAWMTHTPMRTAPGPKRCPKLWVAGPEYAPQKLATTTTTTPDWTMATSLTTTTPPVALPVSHDRCAAGRRRRSKLARGGARVIQHTALTGDAKAAATRSATTAATASSARTRTGSCVTMAATTSAIETATVRQGPPAPDGPCCSCPAPAHL